MARRMVTEWGMSDLGFISLGDDDEPLFLGREIAKHKNFSDEMMRAGGSLERSGLRRGENIGESMSFGSLA